METFICPDCGAEHADPSSAGLGHRIPCADCAMGADIAAESTRPVEQPLAA